MTPSGDHVGLIDAKSTRKRLPLARMPKGASAARPSRLTSSPPAIAGCQYNVQRPILTLPIRSRPIRSTAKAPLPAVIDGAPTGGGGGGARKRKGRAAADGLAEKMASAAAMGGDDVDMDEGAGGKTLGERLRAIEQTAADLPVDARAPAEKQSSPRRTRVLDALGGKGAPPKADSLATLLSQALVAEDRALVERCLNVSDAQADGQHGGEASAARRRAIARRRARCHEDQAEPQGAARAVDANGDAAPLGFHHHQRQGAAGGDGASADG